MVVGGVHWAVHEVAVAVAAPVRVGAEGSCRVVKVAALLQVVYPHWASNPYMKQVYWVPGENPPVTRKEVAPGVGTVACTATGGALMMGKEGQVLGAPALR